MIGAKANGSTKFASDLGRSPVSARPYHKKMEQRKVQHQRM